MKKAEDTLWEVLEAFAFGDPVCPIAEKTRNGLYPDRLWEV